MDKSNASLTPSQQNTSSASVQTKQKQGEGKTSADMIDTKKTLLQGASESSSVQTTVTRTMSSRLEKDPTISASSSLKDVNARLHGLLYDADRKIEELEKKFEGRRSMIVTLQAEKDTLKKQRNERTDRLDKLVKRNDELEDQNTKTLKSFENMQGIALGGLQKLETRDIGDEVLQDEFNDIMGRIDDWISRYAIKNVSDWPVNARKISLMLNRGEHQIWLSKNAKKALEEGKVTERAALSTCMAKAGLLEVMNDCFAWLRDTKSNAHRYKVLRQMQMSGKKSECLPRIQNIANNSQVAQTKKHSGGASRCNFWRVK